MIDYISEDLQNLAVDIDSIGLDSANPRIHDEKNIAVIKGSLQRFGQRKPIVVNRTTMIIEAGNGTWQAAKVLGWEKIAVVFEQDDNLTAAAFGIADNRTSDLASYDDEALVTILDNLKANEFLDGIGWTDKEVEALSSLMVQDWSDFDDKLEELKGMEEVDIKITVPIVHREQVIDWLANGESKTAPGMGKGVMKRCGLL